MVCDTLRDLLAAKAAGCEPHLVRSGRAARLSDEQVQRMMSQVPETEVHADLGAFAEFVLERAHVPHSQPMGLH